MRFLITIAGIITSLQVSAFTNKATLEQITQYHKDNPNAAAINKFSGMVRSFDLALKTDCEEVASKHLKDSFLVYQTDEFHHCMQKAFEYILEEELEIAEQDIQAIKDDSEDMYKQTRAMEILVQDSVVANLGELSKKHSAHCPSGVVRFGSYSGTGDKVTTLFCMYNTLSLLVDTYYENSNLSDLACGSFWSNCDGISIDPKEIKAMVSE